jgi:hypothetical protein
MRRPLLAAVTALAALAAVPVPSHAAAAGAGAVVVPAVSMRRPGDAVVATGLCTYTGPVMTATGVIPAVPPGAMVDVTISCDAYDAYGNWVGGARADQLDPLIPWTVGTSTANAANAVTICGTVWAQTRTWQAHGYGCAPVVPGNVV